MLTHNRKLYISLMAALVFFIIANPETFKIVRSVLGDWVAGPTGCPTSAGLILHTGVYLLITYLLMNEKEKLEGEDEAKNEDDMKEAKKEEKEEEKEMKEEEKEMKKETDIVGIDLSDESQFDTVEATTEMMAAPVPAPTPAPAPAPSPVTDLTRMLSGTSWRKCACEDGGEVLVLK